MGCFVLFSEGGEKKGSKRAIYHGSNSGSMAVYRPKNHSNKKEKSERKKATHLHHPPRSCLLQMTLS